MKLASFTLEILLLSSFAGAAQVSPVPSRIKDQPLPLNQFVLVQQANSTRDFPELVYWGVAGLEWGASRVEAEKLGQRGLKRIIDNHDSFITQLSFDETKSRLMGVVYEADPFSTNGVEKVAEFLRIRRVLISMYGQPSYVQIDKLGARLPSLPISSSEPGSIFLADWKGPETSVTLDFMKDSLKIKFRPSESSHADFLRKQTSAPNTVRSK